MPEVTGKRPNIYLREERFRHRWSQQELADRLGTTPNTISRWELGITSPSPYFSTKLSTLFGKTVQELGVLAERRKPGNELTSRDHQDSISASDVVTPLLWNVPFRRNPCFTGREGVLQQLHGAWHSGAVAALTDVQAISGLGGIGKTHTAVEYAYRFHKDYQAVLWMRADSRELLLKDLVVLADTLRLYQKTEQDSTQALVAIRQWLQEQKNWLLILDNIEDLTTMSDFLPVLHEGHILLTSREPVTDTLARDINLEPLGLEEGALLLLRRAGYVAPNALLEDVPPRTASAPRRLPGSWMGCPWRSTRQEPI